MTNKYSLIQIIATVVLLIELVKLQRTRRQDFFITNKFNGKNDTIK